MRRVSHGKTCGAVVLKPPTLPQSIPPQTVSRDFEFGAQIRVKKCRRHPNQRRRDLRKMETTTAELSTTWHYSKSLLVHCPFVFVKRHAGLLNWCVDWTVEYPTQLYRIHDIDVDRRTVGQPLPALAGTLSLPATSVKQNTFLFLSKKKKHISLVFGSTGLLVLANKKIY